VDTVVLGIGPQLIFVDIAHAEFVVPSVGQTDEEGTPDLARSDNSY
jgi:hypothetical protein